MPIVYTLKLFMIGFSLETRFQATQIGSDSHKDEAKEAV